MWWGEAGAMSLEEGKLIVDRAFLAKGGEKTLFVEQKPSVTLMCSLELGEA